MLRTLVTKLKTNNLRKASLISGSVILLLISVGIIWPETSHALTNSIGEFVVTIIGWAVWALVSLIGQLLAVVIWILVAVAQYNNFINDNTVVKGWSIVRDICNMFFILILLIVAFGTILRLPGYGIKNLLARIVIMAVLINFSRLICGFIIDFAQVIMLTFVNAFKEAGGGNFTHLLGIDQIANLSVDTNSPDVTSWTLLSTVLLAFFYALIAFIVMCAILGVLVMRMIMLWVYVILSPFAYLLGTIPATQSYSKMWWTEFSRNVIVGPILAFFIWLSLSTVGSYDTDQKFNQEVLGNYGQSPTVNLDTDSPEYKGAFPAAGGGTIGTTEHMMRFIISIALLIGGLIVTQKIGGVAGSIAGKGMGVIMAGASWMKKKAMVPLARGYKRAKQVTGVAATQEYMAQRRAAIEKKWDDRTKSGAATIAKHAGNVREFIATPFKAISKNWGNFGRNQAEDLRKGAQEDKTKAESYKSRNGSEYDGLVKRYMDMSNEVIDATLENIVDANNNRLELDGKVYRKDIENNVWEDENGRGFTDAEMQKAYRDHNINAEADVQATNFEQSAEEKERAAQVYDKKQKTADIIGKTALAVGGGILGLATGGLALAPVGAAVGYGMKGAKGLKDLEKIDRNLETNYYLSEIGETRKKIHDSSDEAIRVMMDKSTLKPLERLATVMEAMSRNLLDRKEIEKRRGEFSKQFGGVDEQDKQTPWKNKVLGSKFEAEAAKTVGASYLFSLADPNNTEVDEPTRRAAQDKISLRIQKGDIKMKDMDSYSLASSIEQLAKSLKNGDFIKQYKLLDAARQNALSKALNKSQTKEARHKLAGVTDLDRGFNSMTDPALAQQYKSEFVSKANIEDLSEVINKGTNEQRDSWQNFVRGDQSKVNPVIIKVQTPQTKAIKNFFGFANANNPAPGGNNPAPVFANQNQNTFNPKLDASFPS